MSMKVYYAWKVPANRINDALLDMNEQAIKQESKFLKRIYDFVPDDKIQKRIEEGSQLDPEQIRLSIAISVAMTHNKLSYPSGEVPDSAAANMWFHEGYWYIIQYGNYTWETPEYAEDFAYWNNTDKPDEISEEEWDERKKVWDAILEKEYELKCGHTMLKYEWPHQNMIQLCKTIIEDDDRAYYAFISGTIIAREMINNIEKSIEPVTEEKEECTPSESSAEPSTPSTSDTSD